MPSNHLLVSSALTAVLAMGLGASAHAETGAKEKCFGMAKAGANDCANLSGTHSCAGLAKVDHGADEWNYVAKGSCHALGGRTLDEVKAGAKGGGK